MPVCLLNKVLKSSKVILKLYNNIARIIIIIFVYLSTSVLANTKSGYKYTLKKS